MGVETLKHCALHLVFLEFTTSFNSTKAIWDLLWESYCIIICAVLYAFSCFVYFIRPIYRQALQTVVYSIDSGHIHVPMNINI